MALYWIGQGAQHRDSSLLLNKYKTQYKKQASKWTLRRPTWMVTSSFSPPIILRPNVSVCGGIHKDSSGKLWSIYLTEADEYDEEITDLWRGKADSTLVFTGLFSAVVATFVNISYNNLIPGPTETTNALLERISQQLVDISNGVPTQNGVTVSSEQFTPTAGAVRVNTIWFLSLVLSVAAALNATLFQQWSRRYLELTGARRRAAPHKRARTRAYMFHGIASFKMSRAVRAMPLLLHLSIFLFFAGLINFLWQVNTTIGFWIMGFISLFAFAYLVVTVLPNLYLNCPYSTPVSELSWRSSQYLLLIILKFVHGLEGLFLRYLFPSRQPTVKTRIDERRKWLKLGLQNSITLSAASAPSTMDENALSWTLTVLDDDREFEDFVTRVPGFFDSASVPNAPSVMLSLMSAQSDQFDPVLGSRIDDLLKTCVPGTSPLREELRRNRLRICMKTLWYYAREYNRSGNTNPLPSYVRTVFADPEMTRQIQSEKDPAACLIGCSFSSLIVKKLAQDIGSCTDQGPHVTEAELSCLAAILGRTNAEVATFLTLPGVVGLANIISLTSSKIYTLIEGRMPSEVVDIFRTTLDMLLAEAQASPNGELPPDLVAIFQETYSNVQRLKVPVWLKDRLKQISEVLSVVRDEPEVTGMAMPEPELGLPVGSPTSNTSHISLPSWSRLPSRESSAVRVGLLDNAR
ncbi:hypothetical protein EDB87DRAFT_838251 [Lactarius vividus]|nr:hypothetical protein EDB87DRAFT_838251 [Lactarius vividus]